jgi:cell division protein FtsQ
MSARIARGSTAAKPRPRSKAPARGKGRGKQADTLPISDAALRRIGFWLMFGMAVAVALAVAVAMGVPGAIAWSVGEAVGEAGFSVKRVEIKGLEKMQRLPVYAVALDQKSMAMPLIDLDGTRERLLKFGWVEEARVSRRLPDTMVVDIVERTPSAVWQHNQRLALIDRHGVVLQDVELDAMPDLPLVIGPAANHHAAELVALFAVAPELKPMLAGATWVGGRRWDIRFQSGEVLALPEGQEAAKKALVHFARMDKAAQLLGRGLVRFDMRIPGKIIVRVSDVPGSSVPEMEAAAPPAPSAPAPALDAATTI